ncbi:hypothetical protein K449DRAFT_438613 [Hypoxylon sp. EC38]|nr:hypothetical protein K449DRAFT_438613 [Hypoxylon sp. EC38]
MPKHKIKPIVWVEGMKTPEGGDHPDGFAELVVASKRPGPSHGTVRNPSVTWIYKVPKSREVLTATERIVKEQASRFGMSYAWIMKMGHDFSTVGMSAEGRKLSDDDHHITVRMGVARDTCNLHGHLYVIYEDITPHIMDPKYKDLVPIRMMTERERSVVGGKNPQLWVWGWYPPPSSKYPPAPYGYPKTPFEIKPGSILDRKGFPSNYY